MEAVANASKLIPFRWRQNTIAERRRKFHFRKRSLPFETVDAISQNGLCHLKRSMPFRGTVIAIENGW